MALLPQPKTIDEFVYEIMSWLVFFPVTLWRVVRHPLRMMNYADAELDDTPADRYTDTLSPPIFLLVSLLLSHAIELALVGQSELVGSRSGLGALVKDDTSLIVMRLLVFSTFPILMAHQLVWRQRIGITRQSLREPFYSQCYVAGVLALALGLGTALADRGGWEPIAGLTIIVTAFIAYTIVQARWFSQHLKVGWFRGLVCALSGLLLGLTLIVVLALASGLSG